MEKILSKRVNSITKIAVVFMLFTMVLLSGCGSKTTKIDLMAYTGVTFSGDEGYGHAAADFDYGAFEDYLIGTLGKDDKDTLDFLADIIIIEDAIDITLDKKANLSNGDMITITVSFDDTIAEKYSLDVTGGTQTYEVTGLTVVPEFEIGENDIKDLITNSSITCYLSEIPVTPENVSNIQINHIDSNMVARTASTAYTFNVDCRIAILEVTGQADYRYENGSWNLVGYQHQMAQVKEWNLAGTYTGMEWGIDGTENGCNAKYEITEIQEGTYVANVIWSIKEESGNTVDISATIPLVNSFDTARFVITDNSSVQEALGYAPYLFRALRFDFANGGFESAGELSLKKIDG